MDHSKKKLICKNCDDDIVAAKAAFLNNPLRIQNLPEGTIIDYYLPLVIEEDPANYIDFFRAVRDARSSDKIVLHINCYGGDCNVAFNIIDVLNTSDAHVEIHVEGACASAATMIMLAGDCWEVSEHSYIMIHAWSGCRIGKWNEQIASFEFDKKWMEEKFRAIYKGFLTEDEIESVLAGKDLYFSSEETVKRLEKYQEKDAQRQAVIQKIAEAHQDAINKEIAEALKKFEKADATEEKSKKKTISKSKKE